MSDTAGGASAGARPEAWNAPDRMLLRYARGRLAFYGQRQVLTLIGGAVLAVVEGPLWGLTAILLVQLGELVDLGYLRSLPRRARRGTPIRTLALGSAVTAGVHALCVSGSAIMTWFAAHAHAPLLAAALLASVATNSALVLPYAPEASRARLAIFAVTAVGLALYAVTRMDNPLSLVLMDSTGYVVLAYMVYAHAEFVRDEARRRAEHSATLDQHTRELEEKNEALRQREQQNRRLSQVARNANDSVCLYDNSGTIVWVNAAFTRITGYSLEEAVGTTPGALPNGPDTDPETIRAIARAVASAQPFRGELCNITKDGREIWIETNLVPILGPMGELEMTVAIERDVTASKHAAQELADARDRAEEGARSKANFLANMSHEIRTPMNGVVGMADLLCETPLTEEQQGYAVAIRSSAQALLQIINDILDVSQLGAGRMPMVPVAFDLRESLAATRHLFRTQADAKGLCLTLEIDADVPRRIVADEGRLRQIMVNLIGNAVKFTDAGGVHVVVRRAPDALAIEVRDTGIGIAAEQLDHVFERFAQAESTSTRRFGGTGLGLTISRMLVETMGGRIHATSTIGKGTSFHMTLPVIAAAEDAPGESPGTPATDPAAPAQGDAVPVSATAPAISPATVAETAAERLDGLRVLVAEDNSVNRTLVQHFLRDLPIELHFAMDGREAVEKTGALAPDIVLMDMSMPVMGGLEATREIRAGSGAQPQIVALTANAFESDREACIAAGMDGFLTKPIRRDALLAELSSLRAPPA